MIKKCLYIAAGKLKHFLTDNPFVFVMFFLGSAACSLMFLYFWGNLQYTVSVSQAVSYTATLRSPAQTDNSALFALAETYGVRIDAIYALSDETDAALLCTNRPESFSVWGCEWTALDETGTVIVSDISLLPDEIARELRTVGRTSSRYCFVSQNTVSFLGLPATEIRLTFPHTIPSLKQTEFLQSFAQNTAHAYLLTETTRTLPVGELLGVVLPMLAVYLLCMFAMLYILVYVLEGMAYELSVYGLLGASNAKLVLIPAIVQGVLLAAANGIAVLLHILLYDVLFSRINLYEFAYSPAMYLQASVLMLALSFAVMLIYLRCRIGNYAVVNFRRNLQ